MFSYSCINNFNKPENYKYKGIYNYYACSRRSIHCVRCIHSNELRNKAEAYCSSAEHCSWEVENKLKQWGASDEVAQNIIAHLQKERYVNNSRFCQAFVHDKYLFNRWGRQRIRQELRMRQLDDKDIACGMEEIDDKEYMEGLKSLLLSKNRNIKARNDYERAQKLMRYAAGRGFSIEETMQCIKTVTADEYFD